MSTPANNSKARRHRARLDVLQSHLRSSAVDDQQPMKGVRIIDCSQHVSTPMASHMLADQGADVIKVEPAFGDSVRRFSALYVHINRNKRSVCLDLKTKEGVEALKRLVKESHVFMQNFRPGTTKRLGIDEASLRKVNPSLIYVSVSGFGQTGPYSKKRAYDPIIQATSGLTSIQANKDNVPQMIRVLVPDVVTALIGSQAITAALFKRFRTGRGESITLSMLDAMLYFNWAEGMARAVQLDQQGSGRYGTNKGYVRDMVFQCKDGVYITAGAVTNNEWIGLCKALRREQWIKDPRFANSKARGQNANVRFELTEAAIREMDSEEALRRLDQFDVPSAKINHPREEVISDPQVVHNGILFETEHHAMGRILGCRPPVQFSDAPFTLRNLAPEVGEHTREVLSQVAGYSQSEIDRLLSSQAAKQFQSIK